MSVSTWDESNDKQFLTSLEFASLHEKQNSYETSLGSSELASTGTFRDEVVIVHKDTLCNILVINVFYFSIRGCLP